MDDICDFTDFVGDGTVDRLHDGRHHSCPAGGRHCCDPDPGDSGTKTGVTRRTFAGQGRRIKGGCACRSEKTDQQGESYGPARDNSDANVVVHDGEYPANPCRGL